jgi:glycyl-tRNA synthetase beta chain
MNAHDLLFELCTEELPPRALLGLSQALAERVVLGLDTAGIPHGKVHSFATPRRLAVLVRKLAEHQPDKQVERRGPPLSSAFDAQGSPTQAAAAFAKSCGVAVAELSALKTEKGAWLQFRGTERGAATMSLLGNIVNQAVAALPLPKRMRWGAGATEFIRPVHAVVLLYGDNVIPAEVLGLKAGRVTFGHRFHAPKPINLKSAASYESRLLRARVVADFAARRELIRSAVQQAAMAGGGTALIDDALLDEVTGAHCGPIRAAILEPAARSRDRHRAGSSTLLRRTRCPREAIRRLRHGEQHRKPRPLQGARRQRARRQAASERRRVLLATGS